mmetsp:Transcript_18181/g.36732  ORF Transcript_18181/g.36732 Transcript_18181/m.36732 type:complete len:99 (-) Transcript_18181:1723-2019(-)
MTMHTPECSLIIASRDPCTSFSLIESSALVASSSNRIVGCRIIARAIAMRCFCPPESFTPLSPTCVSSLSGNPSTNSFAFAFFTASQTRSSGVSSGIP